MLFQGKFNFSALQQSSFVGGEGFKGVRLGRKPLWNVLYSDGHKALSQSDSTRFFQRTFFGSSSLQCWK